MDFHPIRPPNATDLTRHNLNELGGQIGWKSIEITLYACLVELGGQIGWKSIESTRHMRQMMPNSTRHHLNGFPPNSTDSTRHHLNELGGRIGWKSIEITLYACLVESVKLGGRVGQIGHHLNGFPPNLTDSTRHHLNELGGRIGCKSIEITLYACLVESVELGGRVGQIGYHLNGFPPNLTNSTTQFNQPIRPI